MITMQPQPTSGWMTLNPFKLIRSCSKWVIANRKAILCAALLFIPGVGASNLAANRNGVLEVNQLQSRVNVWRNELAHTMLSQPTFSNRCFPVTTLEDDLQESMNRARPYIIPDEAELRKYGSKHLNLVKMAHLADALSISELAVPLPRGISTEQVYAFLQKRAPEVLAKWEELRILKSAGHSLNSPEMMQALREIDAAIEKAFKAPQAATDLEMSPEMLSWLEKVGGFLMVRSTGAEDSKQIANAGGNVSKAYVPVTASEVCMAIGDVVRSYFGIPSLQNRLNAGLNPFEEKLSLAVTAQELIGEPVGGTTDPSQIPVSFVLFTNEPLYIGNEKFRVMRLSATYGHGESVVANNGVATDTVLILHSEAHPDQIYYLYNNQKKPVRLAPLQKGEEVVLGKIANPEEMQEKPALNPKQLLDIYRSGVLMEAFFDGDATDIEGVILGGKVHFVQARPVNRKPMLPTYLDVQQGQCRQIKSEILVAGKASVVVAKPEEVLFAETLELAERQFVSGQHKLVIVEQREPENSHPVVNFSSLGVPCLYASNAEEVRDLFKQADAEHPLAVCMQRGTLNLWDPKLGKLEDHIVEGFTVHPAKISISLPVPHALVQEKGVSTIDEELLEQIRSGEAGLEALEDLQNHPQFLYLRAKRAAFSDLEQIPQAVQARLDVLTQLDEHLTRAIEEMRTVLKTHPQDRLRRLIHAKTLETLLKGSKIDSTLGSYRLSDVKPICRSIKMLMDYQEQLDHPSHCIELLLEGEAASDAFPHWRQFLLGLEPLVEKGAISQERLRQFQDLIAALKKSNALPLWLTFFQRRRESPAFRSAELTHLIQFEEMMSEIGPEDWKLIEEAAQIQQSIQQLHNGIQRFADPKSFADAANEYRNLRSMSPSAVKSASPITRSIIYQLMKERIDLLDTAIKTMKASQMFPPPEKTRLFKELLQPFYALMQELAIEHVPSGAIPMLPNWPMGRYLNRIRELLDALSDADPGQLMPSRYSVSAAMLGAQTEFSRHEPATLEDMFTLLHQNSLACINALNQQLITPEQIQHSFLPQAVKETIRQIENENWGRGVQRIGIEMNEDAIILRYNVPLRNHSGHLALYYDIHSEKMVLKAQLLGEARTRWDDTAEWISILEGAGFYIPQRPRSQTAQELTYYLNIDPEKIGDALKDYAAMAEYSLDGNIEHFDPFQRFKDQPETIEKLLPTYLSRPSQNRMPILLKYMNLGKNLQLFIDSAKTHVGSENRETRSYALGLFDELVARGHGFEAAIDAAKMSVASADEKTRLDGFRILSALIEKGHGFEAAIDAAKMSITSADEQTKSRGFNFLLELVRGGHGFEAAIDAAKMSIASADRRIEGFQLYTELVEQGQAIDAAIEIVKANIGSSEVSEYAITLLTKLVKRGLEFDLAIDVARTGFRSDDRYIVYGALKLFEELLRQGQGLETAIAEAKTAMERPEGPSSRFALDLFVNLFEQGQGFEAAIEAVNTHYSSADILISHYAGELIGVLSRYERGAVGLIEIAKMNCRSEDIEARKFALNTFTTLFGNGKGFEAAIEIIKTDSGSEDMKARRFALSLFRWLFTSGQRFKAAIEDATAHVGSANQNVIMHMFDLFKQVIEGEGIEAAEAAVTAHRESSNMFVHAAAHSLLRIL